MKQSKREKTVIRNMQEKKDNHRQYTRKGNMNEWIQELEAHIHCDDFEDVQEQVICKIEASHRTSFVVYGASSLQLLWYAWGYRSVCGAVL